MYLLPKKFDSEEYKTYDKKRLFFDYFSKDEFEEREIEEEEVYGEINIDDPFDGDYDRESEKREFDVVRIADKKNDTAKLFEVKKTKKSHHKRAIGYIEAEVEPQVGQGTEQGEPGTKEPETLLIRVMEKGVVIIWWWWLLLLGGIGLLASAFAIKTGTPAIGFIMVIAKTPYAAPIAYALGFTGIFAIIKSLWSILGGVFGTGKMVALKWLIVLLGIVAAVTLVAVKPANLSTDPDSNIQTEQQTDADLNEDLDGTKPTLEIADGQEWDGKLPERVTEEASQEYIEIAGYSNMLVTEDYQTIALINTEGNTVYQQYIITYDGIHLFDSKLIEPGKQVEWNAWKSLPAGKYEVKFQINTYDIKTQAPCNGANQMVDVEVRK